MILVERREMIEVLLKEIMNVLDFEAYAPLSEFMGAATHINFLIRKVDMMAKLMRSNLAKRRLYNVRLPFASFFFFAQIFG